MRAVEAAQDTELQSLVRSLTEILHASTSCSSSQDTGHALSELLSKSCLAPFLVRELATSYTNMGDRLPFFKEVFFLVEELTRALPSHAGTLLGCVQPHLAAVQASAKMFLMSLGDAVSRVDLEDDVAFAKLTTRIAEEVERLCVQAGLPPAEVSGSSGPALPHLGSTEDSSYCECLRPLQLEHVESFSSHAYSSQAGAEIATPQARTVRLAKELAGLASLLPFSESSSVFVRVDESKQQLWRVLVTGPDDTPYSDGCFIFDCYFPPQYPNEPPLVKLLTTGNSTVTFNPNLYDSGKVCLSLLGTWKGEKGESWDAQTSRMLQVLVSIQSLILVPEPYFNEPGYEREIGTTIGEQRSRSYNTHVRENCIRWAMLDLLQNPLPEFSQVIREHFRLRARKIQETVTGWIAEAEEHGNRQHQEILQQLFTSLSQELQQSQALVNVAVAQ